jgi:NitT/TauT family transport system substrate-binding protein
MSACDAGAPAGSAPSSTAPSSAAKGPAAASASTSVGTIKISQAQPAAGYVPLWLAQDKGLFKKYGLETEVVPIAPPADIQAVMGGDIQIGVGGTGAMSAAAGGANLTFISVNIPVFLQSLFGQPSIQKVSDLIGKSVAVTTKGGPSDFALRTLLAREHVDESKVNVAYLRDDSAMLAAIQSGQVQAAIVTSPNTLRARQAGLQQIVDLIPLKLHTLVQGTFVRKDWAQQRPNVIDGYLKAYLEGLEEAKSNPDVAKATISKWTKLDDQTLVDESYRTTISGLEAYPLVHDEDLQNVIDLSSEPSVKSHKPSDFYDNTYLQKLEPFVNSLWPSGIPSV